MSVLERIVHFAAESGSALAPTAPPWRRYRDSGTGLSFEAPCDIKTVEGPFESLAEGGMTLPYVFDVTFLASRNDASPQELTQEMALQWAVDYDLAAGSTIRRLDYPGVDEAWALSADVRAGAGQIRYSWATLRRRGRIACLGVSCWDAEALGLEALQKTLGSVLGS